MITVIRQALVTHGSVEMFDLVDDVESYPRFLPWCKATQVAYRDPQRTVATIHVDYRGVRQRFTTDNANVRGERIALRLVDGPFRALDGEWRFTALGEAACRIDFRLAYRLANPILERLAGPAFNHIANTLVDAFVHRADALSHARG